MRLFLLLALSLSGCTVDRVWEDLDLSITPFENAWVPAGTAQRRVLGAQGYECPDGLLPRVHVIEPTDVVTPRPLALVLHGQAFDWVNDSGEHHEQIDRLNARWADAEIDRILGVAEDPDFAGVHQGAWVAALLDHGYSVALPGNCWGDLWHGRGDNDLAAEGFLRQGAQLAQDTPRLAAALPNITDQRVIAVGLGEGARAVTEFAVTGVEIDAAIVDAPFDWLSPILSRPAINQQLIAGLQRVWFSDLPEQGQPQELINALRVGLQRDSLVHAVEDLGWRVPIVYSWSSQDERVDPDFSRPASESIAARYPVDSNQVLDWQSRTHAPSNTEPGLEFARGFLVWVDAALGEFTYVPPPVDPVP